MKKLLVVLFGMFLLGSMDKASWDTDSKEAQQELLKALAGNFAPIIRCKEGKVIAAEQDGQVHIFFKCEKYDKLQEL